MLACPVGGFGVVQIKIHEIPTQANSVLFEFNYVYYYIYCMYLFFWAAWVAFFETTLESQRELDSNGNSAQNRFPETFLNPEGKCRK